MRKLIEKNQSKKLIIVLVVVFVFLFGIVLSLGSYYNQHKSRVAGDHDTSEQAKLIEDYKKELKQAFQSYLVLESNTDWLGEDFANKTAAVKDAVLALKVPAEYKDSHLSSVLALTEIERGIDSQNLDLILPNIYKLRDLLANF